MVGQGCLDQKQVGLFRRIFTPTFQNINSHVTIRSVVRDLAYPLFGCKSPYRPWTQKNSGGPKMGSGGVRTKKNQVGLFRRIFTPHSKKSTPTSQFALQFEIWHTPFLAVKVHIGRGFRKISGAQKSVIFAKQVGFLISPNHCSGVSDSTLNSIPKNWRRRCDRMHQMAKKTYF